MQLPPDPSWCARINARPSPPPPSPEVVGAQAEATPPSSGDVASALPVGSPYRKAEIPAVHECELCGTVMYDHNCKIVCPTCGYKRDCSDP